MFDRRLPRIAFAVVLFLLPQTLQATDPPKPAWDVSRISAPNSVAELKLLQETVKTVVDKVTPATVAVMFGPGAGSGVIVSPEGLVLTAAHVVTMPAQFGDIKTCTLVLADGKTTVQAKVLGRNPGRDSGMAQITSPIPKNATWPGAKDGKWPSVEIGTSETSKKGQWVIALGHPGGPKQDRRAPLRVGQVMSAKDNQGFLVTDCTLVGGDSGGPLFDLTGKLIGIHSRIGPFLDENIHVPAKDFKNDWDDLYAGYLMAGKPRLYVGVRLNRDEVDLRVDTVNANSPAEKAGFEAGDVIETFDGQPVPSSDEFDNMIAASKAGKTVPIEVKRAGETKKLFVTIGKVFETDKKPRRRQ